MKIAFYALRDFDELPFVRRFSKEYGIDFVWTPAYPDESNLDLAKGCDAISATPCRMTEEMLETWHEYGVHAILTRAIGFDHVPLAKARELGMTVSNTPYPTDCVADYAIMLMLMCLRQMKQVMVRAEAQDYTLKNKMGRNLESCTVGVVGTGHIGQVLIRHLQGFGCRILAYDKYEQDAVRPYAEYVDLDTLWKESDIVSLHLPASPSTYHMINAESLAKMKNGVILINTARGTLIDSRALIDALKAKKVSAAGLDLLENEYGLYYEFRSGEVLDNEELYTLRSFPNVIVSPHMAFYVESTVASMIRNNFISVHAKATGDKDPYRVQS
ncbi:MAG: D-isomer specific 2-hydroxyacid dehydrogenase family protein [Succiniclasticum sp.]|jgi:lactate dehydrogenase-like 2-hydroxyacid dehydrogenase